MPVTCTMSCSMHAIAPCDIRWALRVGVTAIFEQILSQLECS